MVMKKMSMKMMEMMNMLFVVSFPPANIQIPKKKRIKTLKTIRVDSEMYKYNSIYMLQQQQQIQCNPVIL